MTPRFSLRSLLVVMAAVGILLGVVARAHSRGQRQRQILEQAATVGGYARYDFECYEQSPWYAAQRWLAPRIGADYVGNVQILNFRTFASPELRDSLIATTELTSIEYLSLCCHDPQQENIEQIARLSALKQLHLLHARKLPRLDSIAQLERLESLGLNSCHTVTAEKLRQLPQLPKLKLLDLCYTDAGDEIVPLLMTFPALEELHVEQSSLTAAALARLRDLSTLRVLHVDDSQQEVQQHLPGVKVLVE